MCVGVSMLLCVVCGLLCVVRCLEWCVVMRRLVVVVCCCSYVVCWLVACCCG